MLIASAHIFGHTAPFHAEMSKCISWIISGTAAHIVSRKIATDRQPAYFAKVGFGLNGPQRHIRVDMKGRPLADSSVLTLLGSKIIENFLSFPLNPGDFSVFRVATHFVSPCVP